MTFASLKRTFERAPRCFSPFFVLGDPTPEISVELCCAAVRAGAEALELGLPFSDPIADGPEIAAAGHRARAAGTTTDVALRCLERIAERTSVPLNLLVYGNLVHARGADTFCRDVVDAGASSLLVPDVSLEESEGLQVACRAAGLGHVALVGPSTSEERLAAIDAAATAFLYLVSHQGTTGVRHDHDRGLGALVQRVSSSTNNPVCVGFGLSERAHLDLVFDSGAKLAVVGSAIARVIRTCSASSAADLVSRIEARCRELSTPVPTL